MAFDIKPYLRRPEGAHFERKSLFEGPARAKRPRDRRKVRDQIALNVAALANAEGGVLILGLEDDGTPTGHRYPEEVVQTMLETPRDRLDPPQPPGTAVRFRGVELLFFEVATAFAPVQVTGGGFPLRMGDQTVLASPDQIRALKFQGLVESFESRAATLSLDELDHDLLERAQGGGGVAGLSSLEYLDSRRLVDLRGSAPILRQAAELLFAKRLPEHPNAGVRVFRVVGTERAFGIDHNVEELNRIEGPICNVVESSFRVISQLLRRPSRMGPDGRFKPVPEYPELSWKEAVLNAIAHRDYGVLGRGVEIWLFDDRMEVTSPGGLVPQVTLEQLLTLERVHVSRNPRLVRCLVDLGFMRDQGEGIPRMFAEMERQFLPQPEIYASESEVRLTLRNTPTLSAPDRAFVESLGGQDLTDQEFRALLETYRHGRVDNRRIRLVTGLDTLAASQVLRRLRDRGMLILHAAGPASYYTLQLNIDSLLPQTQRDTVTDRGELEPDRGELEPDRGELEPDRGELTAAEHALIADLGRRPRREKLRDVILELTRRRPWRPADLARVLGQRNVRKLSDHHLLPMFNAGLLERTNPESPTDPNQAYYSSDRTGSDRNKTP